MREVKYIKVHFQPYITQDFIDLFNEKTNGKWISQWFKCPAKKCQNYYLPSELNNLRIHILEEWFDKSHANSKWWIDDETLDMSKIKIISAIKRDEYIKMNPKLRRYMFSSRWNKKVKRRLKFYQECFVEVEHKKQK